MKNAINPGAAVHARHGARTSGFMERVRNAQRRRLFEAFRLFRQGGAGDTVLSLHAPPALGMAGADYLAAWSAPQERTRITSHEMAPRLPGDRHPLRLPFADCSFDWVFCSEAIEHAGEFALQSALVADLYRIARKGVFITTVNRRHPLEFHTGLPFLHWLPPAWWRRLLGWSAKARLAASLHLLESPALYRMAEALPSRPAHDVGHKRVLGIKAYFFLMISKDPV